MPYSPSQRPIDMDTLFESVGEQPDSPLSSNSLIYNGKEWELPLSPSDMELENFQPPLSSSPKITLDSKKGK